MDSRIVMPIVSLSASAGYLVVLVIFGYCGYSMYELIVKTQNAIAESQVVVFQYEHGSAQPDPTVDPFAENASTSAQDPVNTPSLTAPCYIGGCSAQVCSSEPNAVSTCEWRAEYVCYRDATCERQLNGQCGWTRSVGLLRCLKDAKSQKQTVS